MSPPGRRDFRKHLLTDGESSGSSSQSSMGTAGWSGGRTTREEFSVTQEPILVRESARTRTLVSSPEGSILLPYLFDYLPKIINLSFR